MRNKGAFLASLAMILCISVSIAIAVPTQPGKGNKFPPPKFDGTQILVEDPPVTLSTDTPIFVIHGYDQVSWKSLTKEQQKDFFEIYTFELYINDEPVKLKRWKHYYADDDSMKSGFYVQYKAGHFEPGTYTFTGIWLPEGYEASTVVTFESP
jgi:hypothetical protein